MAEDSIVIVGTGAMTAVGVSTAETAASVRAALARFTEIDYYDRELARFTVAEVIDDALPALAPSVESVPGLTARELRMLRLAASPLRESLARFNAIAAAPGLVLALPEPRPKHPCDRRSFLRCLATQTGGAFSLQQSDCSHTGRAGGITAIGQAAEVIRIGQATVMLAGGVDTYRDLYALGTLDLERRVKSEVHLDGFVPGEAAAFVLLARRDVAVRAGVPVIAGLSPVSFAFETGHLYSEEPYRGDGLATAISQLVRAGAIDAPIEEVYSSMNGESHWAKEWGVAYARNRAAFAPAHRIHHPADSLGDTGSACGPLMVALAAHGMKQGYHRAPFLIYGSSDDGPRAAIVVNVA
jgi:3-oxoacyl-[acyl-carrier-protein] synthase-1